MQQIAATGATEFLVGTSVVTVSGPVASFRLIIVASAVCPAAWNHIIPATF